MELKNLPDNIRPNPAGMGDGICFCEYEGIVYTFNGVRWIPTPRINETTGRTIEEIIRAICTSKAIQDTLWMPGTRATSTVVEALIHLAHDLGFDTTELCRRVTEQDWKP